VAAAARRALERRAQQPPSNRGMTPVGLARAWQLLHRQELSPQTIDRMVSYFARHEVDKQGSSWETYGKSRQAWDGWGAVTPAAAGPQASPAGWTPPSVEAEPLPPRQHHAQSPSLTSLRERKPPGGQ